jgi:hypothetical protein
MPEHVSFVKLTPNSSGRRWRFVNLVGKMMLFPPESGPPNYFNPIEIGKWYPECEHKTFLRPTFGYTSPASTLSTATRANRHRLLEGKNDLLEK